jgi:hypothetical protein
MAMPEKGVLTHAQLKTRLAMLFAAAAVVGAVIWSPLFPSQSSRQCQKR